MRNTVSFVIPAYNEREYIGKVLKSINSVKLPDSVKREYIVVDDGSTDGTADFVESLQHDIKPIKVHRMKNNTGKGAALRAGFGIATGEVVMVCDADLEYSTDDIPLILEPLLEGQAEIVYGSRFKGNITGMRFTNRLANRILTLAANVLFEADITDEATAFKAFDKNVLKGIDLKCKGFEFCPEVTAKTLRRGHKITEVPVTYVARGVKEGKKIKWQDGFVAIWTLVKYRFTD